MIISHDQFRVVVFCMNVCVAVVAESVRSSSVAVVDEYIATTDDCMPTYKTCTRRM